MTPQQYNDWLKQARQNARDDLATDAEVVRRIFKLFNNNIGSPEWVLEAIGEFLDLMPAINEHVAEAEYNLSEEVKAA